MIAKLTAQQRLFAHEFARRGNGKQAAIAAGYSPKSAEQQASDLRRIPKVARLIAELQTQQLAKVDASAKRVKQELAHLAFSDIGDAYGPEGQLLPFDRMPEGIRRAVSGVDVEELFEGQGRNRKRVGTLRKVRLWNKLEALHMLAKIHKLLGDMVEIGGKDGQPITITINGIVRGG